MRTRNKFLLTAVGVAAVCTASFAGVALAADPTDTVTAPYAQAAVSDNKAETVTHKTVTVESVTKASEGRYCVKLSSHIAASRSVPVATLDFSANLKSEIFVQPGSANCPANSVLVLTGTDGTAKFQPFHLGLP
ncbi:hypothetical protein ACFCZT_14535 [Streptomyces sp. NPDC056230]|uniref:hypothetical protein n=1 Tax=Streptomyces sp. NPDC056230 TaxID=3345754 RepID=UPI0035DF59D7